MGLEFVIRGAADHTKWITIEEVERLGAPLGLARKSGRQFVFDDGRTHLELYASTVAPGQPGGDALEGDGVRTNRITCHPRPFDFRAFSIVNRLAAGLGWELYDPQVDLVIREAGLQQPAGPDLDAEPGPRTEKRLAKHRWSGGAKSFAALDMETWAVGFGGRTIGDPLGVDLRAGESLDWTATLAGASPPVAVSVDGRYLVTAGPHEKYETGSLRIARLERGAPIGEPTRFPASRAVAWLPDWRSAFVALTADPSARARTSAGCSASALAAIAELERSGRPRLFVFDAETQQVHALAADELDGDPRNGPLAISADGEHLFALGGSVLSAFSMSSGRLIWRATLSRDATWCALAASPCGRFVAVGGGLDMRAPNALRILEAGTGRCLLAPSLEALEVGATSVAALAFHPSGWLAVGFRNGRIGHLTLDARHWQSYVALNGAVAHLAFSPDGRRLLAGGTHEGLSSFTLAESECGAGVKPVRLRSAEERSALVKSWKHADPPTVLSQRDEPAPEGKQAPTARQVATETDAWAASLAPTLESAREALRRGDHAQTLALCREIVTSVGDFWAPQLARLAARAVLLTGETHLATGNVEAALESWATLDRPGALRSTDAEVNALRIEALINRARHEPRKPRAKALLERAVKTFGRDEAPQIVAQISVTQSLLEELKRPAPKGGARRRGAEK